MSLIDETLPTGTFTNLPPPMLPEFNVSAIEDVYSVGPISSERWRSFIDAEKWHPSAYNDSLVKTRAYHARIVWEAAILLSFTDSTWLIPSTLNIVHDTAHFELRKAEFALLSFQFTCGMIGVLKTTKREKIFHCGVALYTTLMWVLKKILDVNKTKEKRKEYVEMQEMRPFSSDSTCALVKNIDSLVFSINSILKHVTFDTIERQVGATFIKDFTAKLRGSVLLLDNILKVV